MKTSYSNSDYTASKVQTSFTPNVFQCPITPAHQTKADRIRAISDEELAMFMAERYAHESFMRLIDEGCTITESAKCALKRDLYVVWLDWLKQPTDNSELGGDT